MTVNESGPPLQRCSSSVIPQPTKLALSLTVVRLPRQPESILKIVLLSAVCVSVSETSQNPMVLVSVGWMNGQMDGWTDGFKPDRRGGRSRSEEFIN